MRIRPSFWAFLRAALSLIEAGKPTTQANIAAELRVKRQAVWCFLKRHPGVWDFVNEQIERSNAQFAGLVLRRHAFIGMQGSVPSAELYLKAQGGHFSRAMAVGDIVPGAGGTPITMNFLIPRPEYPALPTSTAIPASAVAAAPAQAQPPAVGLIPRPNIPRVNVR